MPYLTNEWAPEAWAYILTHWPYLNRSIAAGQTRHFITHTCDQGPSSCDYAERTLTEGKLPSFWNPADRGRVVGHLQWNGRADSEEGPDGRRHCLVCFDMDKDIQLMTAQNTCGPLCGYSREALRQWSLWSPANAPRLAQLLVGGRENLLFYGGRIHSPRGAFDISGRAQVLALAHSPGFKVVNTMGDDPDKPLPVEVTSKYRSFAEEMSKSEFCYSPLGQFEGDTDRYVPAVLFGCIPVMLTSAYIYGEKQVPMALPLSERLDWSKFSVLVEMGQVQHLPAILANISTAKRIRMRRTLGKVWRRFVYSTIYAPYLGEDGQDDAFHTLMEVFAHRVASMPPLPLADAA